LQVSEAVHPGRGEPVTIYIKGFLTSNEDPRSFEQWHVSHQKLQKKYQWSNDVYGYYWQSGSLFSLESSFGSIPVPMATLAAVSLRVFRYLWKGSRIVPSPAQIGFLVAQEVGVNMGVLLYQYKSALAHIDEHAHVLARNLERLRSIYAYQPIRVVAHSLGCKLIMKAVQDMPENERPEEIYLCAPAINEQEYAHILPTAAQERLTIFFSREDAILAYLFPLVERCYAMGCVGSSLDHGDRVHAYNVESMFGYMVHGEYKNKFADLVSYVKEENPKSNEILQ